MSSSEYEQATRGPQMIAISVSLTVISAFFVGLRLFTRIYITSNAGLDDWIMISAMIVAILVTVLQAYEVRYGAGRHISTLTPSDIFMQLKLLYLSIIFYGFCLMLIKISLILQYHRIFVQPWVRHICWALLSIVVCFSIAAIFSSIFACYPVEAFWDKSIMNPRCINTTGLWYSSAAYNIISDIAIFLVPALAVRNLQLSRSRKFVILLIFGIGLFGCITSILRFYLLVQANRSPDFTWETAPAGIWSNIEYNICIICACLITIRPLLRKMFPRFLSKSKQSIEGTKVYEEIRDSVKYNPRDNSARIVQVSDRESAVENNKGQIVLKKMENHDRESGH